MEFWCSKIRMIRSLGNRIFQPWRKRVRSGGLGASAAALKCRRRKPCRRAWSSVPGLFNRWRYDSTRGRGLFGNSQPAYNMQFFWIFSAFFSGFWQVFWNFAIAKSKLLKFCEIPANFRENPNEKWQILEKFRKISQKSRKSCIFFAKNWKISKILNL